MTLVALTALKPSERWAALAFVAAAALAVAVLTEPMGQASESESPVLLPPAAVQGLGRAFMAAPPFDPERRALDGIGSLPGSGPPAVVALAPPPEPPLVLNGILADGDRRRALFAGAEGWLSAGGLIHGWTIDRVEARQVTVHRAGETRVLDASDALR